MRTTFIAAFVALAVGLTAGHLWTERAWKARWEARNAAEAKVEVKVHKDAAVKVEAQANAGQRIGAKAATADQAIQTQIKEIIVYAPKHITPATDSRVCIPYGFVRVLDAAILGVRPDDLPLPTGASDDACAPVVASHLAAEIVANYGLARQNANQLDALIAYTDEQLAILNKEK